MEEGGDFGCTDAMSREIISTNKYSYKIQNLMNLYYIKNVIVKQMMKCKRKGHFHFDFLENRN